MVTLDEIMNEYVKVNFKELPQFLTKAEREKLYEAGFIRIAARTAVVEGINQLSPGRMLRMTLSAVFVIGIVIGMKLADTEWEKEWERHFGQQ